MVYLYTMPGPLIPCQGSVWHPKDKAPVTWPAVAVTSADRDSVNVQMIGHPRDVSFRCWRREEFLDLYEPVRNPEGPVAKRAVRTRWERLLDDDEI
jgi:hypothetical protein